MSDPTTERTWQQTIDRLVDGELSDADARALLALLDGVEGGWRRLALAYVEAQWLRGELPTLTTGSMVATAARPAVQAERSEMMVERKKPRAARLALMSLAVAASMLVAFVLSLRLHDRSAPTAAPSPPERAAPMANNNQGGAPQQRALSQHGASAVAAGLNHAPATEGQRQVAAPEPRLVVLDGRADSLDQAVPQRVIEALRRTGHRVEQHSGVMPVRLRDGRSVNLPYDQVDVQYRGAASTFQ